MGLGLCHSGSSFPFHFFPFHNVPLSSARTPESGAPTTRIRRGLETSILRRSSRAILRTEKSFVVVRHILAEKCGNKTDGELLLPWLWEGHETHGGLGSMEGRTHNPRFQNPVAGADIYGKAVPRASLNVIYQLPHTRARISLGLPVIKRSGFMRGGSLVTQGAHQERLEEQFSLAC